MKVKNLLDRIPRPAKAIFCAVCVILLAIMYYIALGCPTTFRQEFRRAEKAHMVGPSVIVDQMLVDYSDFDKMLVGETKDGICFFGRYYDHYPYRDLSAEKRYHFTYVEKTGDLTIVAAPNAWGHSWAFHGFERSLPVYLFTEQVRAARAELEITVRGSYSKFSITKHYEHTFQGEAARSDSGVFRFWFSADTDDGLAALNFLSTATGGSAYMNLSEDELATVFPATVRLYDVSGNLILERELKIQPKR